MPSVKEEVTMDTIVIELANSLNRFRSLTEQESRWVEASVRREEWRKTGGPTPRWAAKDDIRLKRMVRNGKQPRAIARAMGRSEQAVWSRIRFLRRKGQIGYYRPEWAKLPCAESPIAMAEAAE